MSPPTVAACSDWAKELQSSRFGALHRKSNDILLGQPLTCLKLHMCGLLPTRDLLAMQ